MERAAENLRPFLIDIVTSIVNGKLSISFIYSKVSYSKNEIISFAEYFKSELTKLLDTNMNMINVGFTASDFHEIDLDEEELGSIFSELNEDFEDE